MNHIPSTRLKQHNITAQNFTDPQSLVAYMGAIQAQDFPMAKWAIGLRLPEADETTIENALNAGALVRTHIMRPTWHIVAAHDVRWMMALTGKNIKKAFASHDRDLGVDASLYARVNDLIVKALEGNNHLTRAEIMEFLEQNGVKTGTSRATLFMMNAETDALVCNGVPRGKDQTYALLDEKVPAKGLRLSHEESLAELAKRYFTSHAPATIHDFHWWSGLSMTDAKAALASIESDMQTFDSEGKTYVFEKNCVEAKPSNSLFLLPAFDEYCVSYKDRADVFAPEWQSEAITSNGIFKPIIVINGRVEGVWKRTIKKNTVMVESQFFTPQTAIDSEQLTQAKARFGQFLGLTIGF